MASKPLISGRLTSMITTSGGACSTSWISSRSFAQNGQEPYLKNLLFNSENCYFPKKSCSHQRGPKISTDYWGNTCPHRVFRSLTSFPICDADKIVVFLKSLAVINGAQKFLQNTGVIPVRIVFFEVSLRSLSVMPPKLMGWKQKFISQASFVKPERPNTRIIILFHSFPP